MSAVTLVDSPPLPQPDEFSQFFWDAIGKRELQIQRCQDCKRYIHYPKPICRFCHSRDLAGEPVSGRATLYSWTVAVQAFHPFWIDRLPYVIATVELEEQPGLMMCSQIVECREEDLIAGMRLTVLFEEVAPDLTLPFFRPAAVSGEGER
jgi:uncharacterized OB-fold protein